MTDTTPTSSENPNVQRLIVQLSSLEVRGVDMALYKIGEELPDVPLADKQAAVNRWLRSSPEHARFFPGILSRGAQEKLFPSSVVLRDVLMAALPHGAERILMSYNRLREQFMLADRDGGRNFEQVVLAAIEQCTILSSATFSVEAIFNNLGPNNQLLVVIGRRLQMNLAAATFIARLLLQMEKNFGKMPLPPEYYELRDKLADYIASRPMEPEDNAAIAYRYALMGGVQVNGAGVPDWDPGNRIGDVPRAKFNPALRRAVERGGWFFAPSWDDSGLRRNPDGQVYYRHNPDGWRQDRLLHLYNEVMLPCVPPVDAHRIGKEVRIQFHPVAIPTMETLRGISKSS